MTLPIINPTVVPRTGLRLVDVREVTRPERARSTASLVDLLQVRILDRLRPGSNVCIGMSPAAMRLNGCDPDLPILRLVARNLQGQVRGGITIHDLQIEDETARVLRASGKPVPFLEAESLSLEDTWVAVQDFLLDNTLRAAQGTGIEFTGWDLHVIPGQEWIRDADESQVEPELRGIGGKVVERVGQGRQVVSGPGGVPITIRGRRSGP